MMRILVVLAALLAGSARAELLEDRVVLASGLARAVIVEAQSRESIFFERCEYDTHEAEPSHEISAERLSACAPLGPILPNAPEVREYLEQRFVTELEKRLEKLDRAGHAGAIARTTALATAAGGVTTTALEYGLRRPGLRRSLTTGAIGAGAAGAIALVVKTLERRHARVERRRSRQILEVIDLRIPPEPHFVDQRTTSRREAVHVMKLFTESLRIAAEQTRAAAPILTYREDPPTSM